MRSSDFRPIVEPRGVKPSGYKDSTRMQVIRRGAAQSNQILGDFKRGPKTCSCED
jgi:hypothetical protein